MEPIEILRQVRELIADPGRWTKHASARDSYRNPTEVWDADAYCFCLSGAIRRTLIQDNELPALSAASDHFSYNPVMEAVGRALVRNGFISVIPLFNDRPSTTHADVLAVVDGAIAELAKEPETA